MPKVIESAITAVVVAIVLFVGARLFGEGVVVEWLGGVRKQTYEEQAKKAISSCMVEVRVSHTLQCQSGTAGNFIELRAQANAEKGKWGDWSTGIPTSDWKGGPWTCMQMRIKCD